MVTSKQRKEIKRRMIRIREAKDKGDLEVAKARTTRLMKYMQREGLYNPDE